MASSDNNHLQWPEGGNLAGVHAPHQLLAGLWVTPHHSSVKKPHAPSLKAASYMCCTCMMENLIIVSSHTQVNGCPRVHSLSSTCYDGERHCCELGVTSRSCQSELMELWWKCGAADGAERAEMFCNSRVDDAFLITPRWCRKGRNSGKKKQAEQNRKHQSALLHHSGVRLLLAPGRRTNESKTDGKSPLLRVMIRPGPHPIICRFSIDLFLHLMCYKISSWIFYSADNLFHE